MRPRLILALPVSIVALFLLTLALHAQPAPPDADDAQETKEKKQEPGAELVGRWRSLYHNIRDIDTIGNSAIEYELRVTQLTKEELWPLGSTLLPNNGTRRVEMFDRYPPPIGWRQVPESEPGWIESDDSIALGPIGSHWTFTYRLDGGILRLTMPGSVYMLFERPYCGTSVQHATLSDAPKVEPIKNLASRLEGKWRSIYHESEPPPRGGIHGFRLVVEKVSSEQQERLKATVPAFMGSYAVKKSELLFGDRWQSLPQAIGWIRGGRLVRSTAYGESSACRVRLLFDDTVLETKWSQADSIDPDRTKNWRILYMREDE